MNIHDYQAYFTAETMMGPNCIRILEALLGKHPLRLDPDQLVLDLGCGKGLTSFVIAKETGAQVYANDLWIPAEENGKRFVKWGVEKQITPFCEDANRLPFEAKQFDALVSIDAYHYFAGRKGFFQEKILPILKAGSVVLIGSPGLKNDDTGRAGELLSDWLGDEAGLFKTPECWKAIIGQNERMAAVETWELNCFDAAWQEWFASGHKFAQKDRQYFETIIRPYTCFVGIYIKMK